MRTAAFGSLGTNLPLALFWLNVCFWRAAVGSPPVDITEYADRSRGRDLQR